MFTGKIWYIAGTVAGPHRIAVKVISEILCLFWSDKTALVNTEKLSLPRQLGGWNIPSVTNSSVAYALASSQTTERVLFGGTGLAISPAGSKWAQSYSGAHLLYQGNCCIQEVDHPQLAKGDSGPEERRTHTET